MENRKKKRTMFDVILLICCWVIQFDCLWNNTPHHLPTAKKKIDCFKQIVHTKEGPVECHNSMEIMLSEKEWKIDTTICTSTICTKTSTICLAPQFHCMYKHQTQTKSPPLAYDQKCRHQNYNSSGTTWWSDLPSPCRTTMIYWIWAEHDNRKWNTRRIQ